MMGMAATMGMGAPTRGVVCVSVGLNKCTNRQVWSVVEWCGFGRRLGGL